MGIKIKSSSFVSVAIILYSLFAFSRNSVGMVIPMIIWFAIIAASVVMIIVFALIKHKLPLDATSISMFYIIVIMLIYNNQDFAHNVYMDYLVIAIPIFIALFAQRTLGWHELFKVTLVLVSLFYSFWTIICAVDNNVYNNFCLPFLRNYMPELSRGNFTCGFTTHYSTNGMYIALGSLVLLADVLAQRRVKRHTDKKTLFLLFICVAGLLLCGKRGILLCVIISFALAYLLFTNEFGRGAKLALLLCVICAVIYIASIWVPSLLVIAERFKTQISSGDIATGRFDLWKEGWNGFANSPLSGNGWGWFRYNNSFGTDFHVHNCYLQWLCELGLIFSIPFFIFIVISYIDSLRMYCNLRNKSATADVLTMKEIHTITFAFIYETYFLIFMFEGTGFYEIQSVFPYFMCVAMVQYYKNQYHLLQKIKM